VLPGQAGSARLDDIAEPPPDEGPVLVETLAVGVCGTDLDRQPRVRMGAAGEWDICRNGRYTEHGIKELDGFMHERYRIDPRYTVKLDPSLARTGVLLEPTRVVAKA
jgi:threonine dehydrogenase-like Zn-dependent dehydrogenase